MAQGNFLQKLSDSLEESRNKIITKLPVGSAIVANNYFWLHGRKPFVENKQLSRELLRIRGKFFPKNQINWGKFYVSFMQLVSNFLKKGLFLLIIFLSNMYKTLKLT